VVGGDPIEKELKEGRKLRKSQVRGGKGSLLEGSAHSNYQRDRSAGTLSFSSMAGRDTQQLRGGDPERKKKSNADL